MRGFWRWLLIVSVVLSFVIVSLVPARAAEPLKFSSSTQFLWGTDELGQSQNILGQYLLFSYTPEGQKFSVQGYGRVTYALNDTSFTDGAGFGGRLYYLFLDWNPSSAFGMRIGRQFVAFTSGEPSSVLDGARFDLHNLGPFGLTVAAGWDVAYALSGEFEQYNNTFWAADLHLEAIKGLQAGISFAQRYNSGYLATEAIGTNLRWSSRYFSPYLEARYEWLTKTFSQATIGVNIYPINNLYMTIEYYSAYPTFDSTSIYSVFANDEYQQIQFNTEYNLEAPVTLYGQYIHQWYSASNADSFTVGAKFYPIQNLTVAAGVSYRSGYGGNLVGFEAEADYKLYDKFVFSAGVQWNEYKLPVGYISSDPTMAALYQTQQVNGFQDATRIWIGGQWNFAKNASVLARLEDNMNPNFNNRFLGRVALNWNF